MDHLIYDNGIVIEVLFSTIIVLCIQVWVFELHCIKNSDAN